MVKLLQSTIWVGKSNQTKEMNQGKIWKEKFEPMFGVPMIPFLLRPTLILDEDKEEKFHSVLYRWKSQCHVLGLTSLGFI